MLILDKNKMQNSQMRFELLNKLINFKEPINELIEKLNILDWDFENSLVTLNRNHIVHVIELYLANKISKNDLILWAESVEKRDGIQYEIGFEKIIASTLFELNSLEINNPLDRKTLLYIIGSLILRDSSGMK